MKKIIFSLVAMMIATVSFAQNSLVATLSHDGEVKMFYGVDAFKNAMAAAVDGDAISLSGGQFQATDITKAVSVRGTGIGATLSTVIINDFIVNVPAYDSLRFAMEGVKINNILTITGSTKKPYFLKCKIEKLRLSGNTELAKIVNCDISDLFVEQRSSSQFVGCFISNFNKDYTTFNHEVIYARAEYINCVINLFQYQNTYRTDLFFCSALYNCILVGGINTQPIPVTSTAQNCICIGREDPFGNMSASLNNVGCLDLSIFVDEKPLNNLTDEAKTKYLGTDGTPVGMYGGPCPYDMTPSYPIVTKMNVANKTTEDGMLEVEINAE